MASSYIFYYMYRIFSFIYNSSKKKCNAKVNVKERAVANASVRRGMTNDDLFEGLWYNGFLFRYSDAEPRPPSVMTALLII